MPRKRVTRKKPGTKRVKRWKEVPTTALVPDDGEVTDAEPVQEVEEPELTPEDADVADVLDALPQDAKVELWCWDMPTDDWGYITRYPAHGFNIDAVAREYGPGKYRMIIRGPVEGRMRIRGRKIFSIGGPPLAAKAAGASSMVETSLADLVKIQSEVMRANLSQPRESMADVVKLCAELMRPPAPVAQVDPFKQAIEIVQLLRDGSGDKGTSFKDVKELLEMGMELGGSGTDDGLGVFGKSLAGLLERLEQKKAEGAPPAPDPKQIPAQSEAMTVLKEFFTLANQVLSKAAARNADLDFYADWVADNVPDMLDPYFGEWFSDPAYPEIMVQMFPGVAPEWLRPLLLKVRALLTQPEEISAVDTGNGDEPAGHDKVSAGDGGDDSAAPEGGRGDIPDVADNGEVHK